MAFDQYAIKRVDLVSFCPVLLFYGYTVNTLTITPSANLLQDTFMIHKTGCVWGVFCLKRGCLGQWVHFHGNEM